MASCSFTHNGRTFTLTVENASYSIANNTSSVNWTLSISGGGGVWYDSYAKATVNGSVVYNVSMGWNNGGAFPAGDGSVSGTVSGIGHNSDGSGYISFALEGYSYSYDVQYTSGGLTLTTIPRASGIDSFVCSKVTLDGLLSVIFTPKASSFYYKVRYSIPGVTTIRTDSLGNLSTATQCHEINFTSTELETIYNKIGGSASSCKIGCVVETYANGYSTKVGESSESTLTLSMPLTIVPTISGCTVDIKSNEWTPSKTLYVQNQTTPKFTISASSSYGATISKYEVVIDGVRYTNTSNTIEAGQPFRSAGCESFTVYATDTRGRRSSKSYTTSFVYSYATPTADINVGISGTTVSIVYTITASSVNKTNAKSLVITQLKPSTGDTTEYTIDMSGMSWSSEDGKTTFTNASNPLQITVEDIGTQTYTYTATFTDALNTATATHSTGFIAFSLLRGGKGAAFFGDATSEGLTIYGDVHIGSNKLLDYAIYKRSGSTTTSGGYVVAYREVIYASGDREIWLKATLDTFSIGSSSAGMYYGTDTITIPDEFFSGTTGDLYAEVSVKPSATLPTFGEVSALSDTSVTFMVCAVQNIKLSGDVIVHIRKFQS